RPNIVTNNFVVVNIARVSPFTSESLKPLKADLDTHGPEEQSLPKKTLMYFQVKRLEGLLDDALVLNVSFKGLFYADRLAERSLFHRRLFDPISDSPEPDTTLSKPVRELLRGYLA